MKVEVLFFRGCPNHPSAVENLRLAARELGCTLELTETEVGTAEGARQLAFLGSPSIRVEGFDVEPGARDTSAFGLGCRSYVTSQGRTGTPSVTMILEALQEAIKR